MSDLSKSSDSSALPPTDASVAPIPPERLGTAELTPRGEFEAGSYAAFTLTYTAGHHGIDDSGSLRIVFRFASDQIRPQFENPEAPSYTTVEASNNAVLEYRYDPKGNLRPWDRTLYIKVVRGFLREGDTITVRFGDTRRGSPGLRLQTFCEETFEFRVLVDPIATFHYQPLPEQPVIKVVPGPAATWRAVLPSLVRAGEPFRLCLKAEDAWGNPTDKAERGLRLRSSAALANLPEALRFRPGQFTVEIDGLTADAPGEVDLEVLGEDGAVLARANPLRVVAEAELLAYWADLHGQSEETIGTNGAQA